jgi:hypothetical protein
MRTKTSVGCGVFAMTKSCGTRCRIIYAMSFIARALKCRCTGAVTFVDMSDEKPPAETQLDRIEALLRMLYRQQGEMKQALAKLTRQSENK